MSEGKSCTICGHFEPMEHRCNRVIIGRKGVKVMRPDFGACLYWKPIEVKTNKKGDSK